MELLEAGVEVRGEGRHLTHGQQGSHIAEAAEKGNNHHGCTEHTRKVRHKERENNHIQKEKEKGGEAEIQQKNTAPKKKYKKKK